MCSQREREAVDGNGAQIPPKQPAVAMPCTNTLTHLRKYAYKHTLTHVPIHKHKCWWQPCPNASLWWLAKMHTDTRPRNNANCQIHLKMSQYCATGNSVQFRKTKVAKTKDEDCALIIKLARRLKPFALMMMVIIKMQLMMKITMMTMLAIRL